MEQNSKIIGKRLEELRHTLTEDTNTVWTQVDVAREIGLTQKKVSRLESGQGLFENFLKIFLFYYSKGFNLNWILIPENQNFSKYRVDKFNGLEIDTYGIISTLLHLKTTLVAELDGELQSVIDSLKRIEK